MSTQLNLADDFERWIKLADFYARRHDERRNYEWKITLGLWAAIFATKLNSFEAGHAKELYPYWLIAWLFFAVSWVYGTWFRNKEDIVRQHFAERAATLTNDRGAFKANFNPFLKRLKRTDPQLICEFVCNWARLFQNVATFGIMWFAWDDPLEVFGISACGRCVVYTLLVLIIIVICMYQQLKKRPRES